MTARITLPKEFEGLEIVASVSGGKDSTAMMLALREAGIPFRAVFADTGWEAPETYEYLDLLREKIGPIDVVGHPGGMPAKIRARAGFPARLQRWCTKELKVAPLGEYHDAIGEYHDVIGTETVSAVGVRAQESASRAQMPEIEDSDEWGGWVWRPLISWTVEQVIGVHKRHGVPMNPLYHQGFDRVGCFPCIFARKEEIRLLPEWRLAEIEALEAETGALRAERNAEEPGRYSFAEASFFQTMRQGFTGIRKVHEWARTEHGGKQLPLLPPIPQGGCMRWGMCESPKEEE